MFKSRLAFLSLCICVILNSFSSFSQAPNISYNGGSTKAFVKGEPITTYSLTNSGGNIRGCTVNYHWLLPDLDPITDYSQDNAIDKNGNVFVLMYSGKIQKITPSGTISTVFTGKYYWAHAIAVDKNGNLYVADRYAYRVFKIYPNGTVENFAGNGYAPANNPSDLDVTNPTGVAIEPLDIEIGSDGSVYIAEKLRIRKVKPNNTMVTYVGNVISAATKCNCTNSVSGTGTSGYFDDISLLKIDRNDNLFVKDGKKIRKITAGTLGTVADYHFDNDLTTFAIHPNGTIYYDRQDGDRVMRLETNGNLSVYWEFNWNDIHYDPWPFVFDAGGYMYAKSGQGVIRVKTNDYTIAPTLPAGLSFNGCNGEITGTPTTTSAATNYTVVGYNSYDTDTTIINLMVVNAPTVTTNAITSNTQTTGVTSGVVADNGGKPITERGICWNTSTGPTISNSKLVNGSGVGSFNATMQGLAPNTTYYVRAYATTVLGTYYGAEQVFSTNIPPVITSNGGGATATIAIVENSAAVTTVTATDIDNPANNQVITYSIDGGADASKFTMNATTGALSFRTAPVYGNVNTYTVIVKASDNGSIVKSATQTITVNINALPKISTTSSVLTSSSSAIMGGNLTNLQNQTVTERGVVWHTSSNPTTALSTKQFISNGITTGSFTSTITGLQANTTYYVKAYAVCSLGTSYGAEDIFSTNISPVITSNGGGLTATVTLQEKQTLVTTVTATDADAGQTKTFTISGGSDAAKFTINSSTGVLSFRTAPIYGSRNTYEVIIKVTDNGSIAKSTTQSISVNVTDIPEVETVSPTVNSSTSVSTGGNIISDAGMTIKDKGVCYSINQNPTIADSKSSQGANSDSYTNTLSVTANTRYFVRAYVTSANVNTVTDSVYYGAQYEFTTNQAPVFSSATAVNFNEGQAITTTVIDVNATDADAGQTITYSLGLGGDAALFQINSSTGIITFRAVSNFSVPKDQDKNNSYIITVYATDNGNTAKFTTQTITINVMDVAGEPTVVKPTLTYTATSATMGGDISYTGGNGAAIIERGIVYCKTFDDTNPNIGDANVTKVPVSFTGTGVTAAINDPFTTVITGLLPSTSYTFKAYALSDVGQTGYSRTVVFTTNATAGVPSLTFSTSSNIFNLNTTINPFTVNNTGGSIAPTSFKMVSDFAGSGTSGGADNENKLLATMTETNATVMDALGNTYVVEEGGKRVRKIAADGTLSTIKQFTSFNPMDIAINTANGDLYITISNHRICKIPNTNSANYPSQNPVHVWTDDATNVIAGSSTAGTSDGTGTNARFNLPAGLVMSPNNDYLLIADYYNSAIRKMTIPGYVVTTFAGLPGTWGNTDGTSANARFENPCDVVLTENGNTVYVVEKNDAHTIRKIESGTVTTILGNASANGFYGYSDGVQGTAQMWDPYGLALDKAGNLYISEDFSQKIRKYNLATGMLSTLSGMYIGHDSYYNFYGNRNGRGTYARFNYPHNIFFNKDGYLLIGDKINNKVRRIDLSGYEISHALPAGLNFDEQFGKISGTPKSISLKTYYKNNFNDAQLGTTASGGIPVVSGDASMLGELLRITPYQSNKMGGFTIPASGQNSSVYKISFKLITGVPVTEFYNPADGISYSFADDADATNTSIDAEIGTGTKLSLSFDNYDNSGLLDNNGLYGIRLYYGVKPTSNPNINIAGSLLAYSNNTSWMGKDVPVELEITEAGKAIVKVDNVVIFDSVQLPIEYIRANKSNWKHVFKARTASRWDIQGIDDLVIQEGKGAAEFTITGYNGYGKSSANVNIEVVEAPLSITYGSSDTTYAKIINALSTNKTSYQNAADGAMVEVSAQEYEKIIAATGANVLGQPTAKMKAGLGSGFYTNNEYTEIFNAPAGMNVNLPANGKLFGFAFSSISATNTFGPRLGINATNSTDVSLFKPVVSDVTIASAGTHFYIIKNGTTPLNAPTKLGVHRTNTMGGTTPNSNLNYTWGSGDVSSVNNRNNYPVLGISGFYAPDSAGPYKYKVGTLINPQLPTVKGGAVASYAITPQLPAGLQFNTTTGEISGTPTTPTDSALYTITATNASGAANTFIAITVLDVAPATLSYPNLVATNNTAITNLVPTKTGGIVRSYSITPALPYGLTLNTSTGIISGTPIGLSSLQTYTATAENSYGTATCTFSITVNDATPSVTYSNTTATKNTSIQIVSPFSVGGEVVSYAITPSLPAGLILNTSTGVISGTPTVAVTSQSYTITATNTGGTYSATITILVNDEAPVNLTYNANSTVATKGVGSVNLTATNTGGTPTTYSISPSLPSGLNFNTSTGTITGTALVVSGTTSYTITATNVSGTVTATIAITVLDVAPGAITYANLTATEGVTINAITPTVSGGGVITTYTVSPNLPNGLLLNSTTGVISGKPVGVNNAQTYTVTATNSGGFTTTTLTIVVNAAAPISVTYANTAISVLNGSKLSDNTPIVQGGLPTQYTIAPQLPRGLSFDTRTGVVGGFALDLSPLTTYTITGTNSVGSVTTTITIEVLESAPLNLYYASTAVLSSIGGVVTTLTPSYSGGKPSSFAITPSLPTGLVFNSVSGEISGTPTTVSGLQNYTITASNASGTSSCTIQIKVDDQLPVFQYPFASLNTVRGVAVNLAPTAINTNATSFTTGTIGFTISPSLPAGLSFDPATGKISGIPTSASPLTTYTITITKGNANSSITIDIEILDAAPSDLLYTSKTLLASDGTTITTLTPTYSGGAPTSFTVSPALPAGLTIDPITGVISGTVTSTSAATTYVITATNSIGSTTANVVIEINNNVPELFYAPTKLVAVQNTAIDPITPFKTNTSNNQSFSIGVLNFTVTPALPSGLQLNVNDGTITGTPLSVSAATDYAVTSSNGISSSVASLSISIQNLPTITTNTANNITYESAFSGGTIASDGGLEITSKGICWSTNSNPTISDANLYAGAGINAFTAKLAGLNPSTTYHLRAYATNAAGTSYGPDISFTTNAAPNVDLANLVTNQGIITPVFNAGVTSYSMNVANATSAIRITPTLADPINNTVKVNGVVVNSGSSSNAISLQIGTNTITILVSGVNGSSKIYTISIVRSATTLSTDASLGNLQLSTTGLYPVFNAAITSYTLNVANTISSLQFTPSLNQANASVTINGIAVTNGNSSSVALNVGTNTITIVVTAEDGITTKTYTIVVTRVSGALLDTDGDGVPDAVELQQGSDPNDPTDAKDTDGDGVPDYIELQQGSDPNDASSKIDIVGVPVVKYVDIPTSLLTGNTIQYIPVSSGGAVTSYTVSPQLPLGITLNAQTGVIYGTLNSASKNTTYSIVATNSAGARTTKISFGVLPYVASITGPKALCGMTSIQLANATKGGVWETNNSNAVSIDANGKLTALGNQDATITITYKVTLDGISNTVNYTVNYTASPEKPQSTIIKDQVLNEAFQLDARKIGTAYEWSPAVYLNNPSIPSPLASISNETTFNVKITLPTGCTVVDTVMVRIFKEADIILPNAFSPNGDGINDYLQINLVQISQFKYFKLFDRYGNLIFETLNPSINWNGTINGKPLNVDTYFWVASGTDNNGLSINRTGAIVITK